MSFYILHQRKDISGDDAEIFRPETWETLQSPPCIYLPFGSEPLVFPRQQLALTEVRGSMYFRQNDTDIQANRKSRPRARFCRTILYRNGKQERCQGDFRPSLRPVKTRRYDEDELLRFTAPKVQIYIKLGQRTANKSAPFRGFCTLSYICS